MTSLRGAVAVMLMLLASCGFPLAPVSEQGVPLRQPESGYRAVRAGDTLYSIAWESGRDYRDLARWNGISPPYVIKPGQNLRLYPPSGLEHATRPAQKPPSPSPGRHVAAEKTSNEKKSAIEKPSATARPPAPTVVAKSLDWIWPTDGSLLERYSANGPNKGIDIAGRKGQPILAAAPGQVVYQGGGLRGYGQLIIIKHNADFLSAYAHCDKIYVKEGNVIKRGQKIADMGSSGTDRAKLHFEVRYRGAPVDPQDYLPRK
ncbi:MAG: peptidoglycan DD-metalloendopeptidase family protein [Gammaproteobacteria bacterium]|nr:peptidoglycan DD-metalloendopeptidase family protein [Gammaproteobacteria bacterium]